MPKRIHLSDITTDLRWKRTYLNELEKKRRRQDAAVADTDEEIATVQKEIAKLEQSERPQERTD